MPRNVPSAARSTGYSFSTTPGVAGMPPYRCGKSSPPKSSLLRAAVVPTGDGFSKMVWTPAPASDSMVISRQSHVVPTLL